MVISIEAGKASDKTKHPFMLENTQQTRNRREPGRGLEKTPTATTIISDRERLSASPFGSGTKQGCPLPQRLRDMVLDSVQACNIARKQIGKERGKTCYSQMT